MPPPDIVSAGGERVPWCVTGGFAMSEPCRPWPGIALTTQVLDSVGVRFGLRSLRVCIPTRSHPCESFEAPAKPNLGGVSSRMGWRGFVALATLDIIQSVEKTAWLSLRD
jgi:hypothetical protein